MPKFTWGDSARVSDAAPAKLRPGSAAAVVGFSEAGERRDSYVDDFPHGVVYTVEFEDGSDAEVHEDHLIPLNDDLE